MSKLNTMTSVEKKAGDTDAATSYAGKETAVKAVLVEGEKVLVQGRIHPAIYWKAGPCCFSR